MNLSGTGRIFSFLQEEYMDERDKEVYLRSENKEERITVV